jgi:hypothetical protein
MFMKHFTFAFVMIVAGTVSIHATALAQFDPKSVHLLGEHHLTTLTAIDGTLTPEPITPVVVYTNLEPISKMATMSGNLSVSEDQSVVMNFVPMLPHPTLTLDLGGNPSPIADSGSPADLSGSNGPVGTGSGNNNSSYYYQQPAPVVRPVVSNVSPIYTYVPSDTTPVKKVPTKKVSLSSDHESDIISTPSDNYENRSSYGASTYSLGTSINLVGMLLIILGVITLVVIAGEYQHRKQKEADARAAAYRDHAIA